MQVRAEVEGGTCLHDGPRTAGADGEAVGLGAVARQMRLELELLAAVGDGAAVRPVRRHVGGQSFLPIEDLVALAARILRILGVDHGDAGGGIQLLGVDLRRVLEAAELLPVRPATVTESALHMGRAPGVPLRRGRPCRAREKRWPK